jgi:hypothetical protein
MSWQKKSTAAIRDRQMTFCKHRQINKNERQVDYYIGNLSIFRLSLAAKSTYAILICAFHDLFVHEKQGSNIFIVIMFNLEGRGFNGLA